MKAERADLVGRAYRHDVCSTNRYLLAVQDGPPADRLTVPVDVVVADDDPTSQRHRERYRRWLRVPGDVTLHPLPDGGHYFIRSRAAAVAALIASAWPAVPA